MVPISKSKAQGTPEKLMMSSERWPKISLGRHRVPSWLTSLGSVGELLLGMLAPLGPLRGVRLVLIVESPLFVTLSVGLRSFSTVVVSGMLGPATA